MEVEALLEEDVKDWGNLTTMAILLGMGYGGTKEALASSAERESVLPSRPATGPGITEPMTERHVWRVRRDMAERSLIRITRGGLVGGAKLGLFVAAFGGVQVALASAREHRDAWNSAGAGAVAAGVLGLSSPGTVPARLLTSATFAVLGGVISIPLGFLHSYNSGMRDAQLAEEARAKKAAEEKVLPGAGVGTAIARLERSLDNRPHR